jgi:hypothetical protein
MTNHAFVIRIWLEEIGPETGEPKWRGHIVHLPSRTERYFDQLQTMLPFIEACLTLAAPGGEVPQT